MLELWLIRHGATEWHGAGRLHGQTDVALGTLGLEQARKLKARLASHTFDAVYSSDLSRALATARAVLGGRDLVIDERLREMAYGILEGKNKHFLSEADRQTLQACRDDAQPVPAPGGESWRDLEVRVCTWLTSLPPTGRVAAFTHGGAIRCAVSLLTADPVARDWRVRLDYTSLTRLTLFGGKSVLEVFGDASHLDEKWEERGKN